MDTGSVMNNKKNFTIYMQQVNAWLPSGVSLFFKEEFSFFGCECMDSLCLHNKISSPLYTVRDVWVCYFGESGSPELVSPALLPSSIHCFTK